MLNGPRLIRPDRSKLGKPAFFRPAVSCYLRQASLRRTPAYRNRMEVLVLAPAGAGRAELLPLLTEAKASNCRRVHVTTPGDVHVTQHTIQWLTELYNLVATVDARLDVVPCLACAGWTPVAAGKLPHVQSIVAPETMQQQAMQMQQHFSSSRASHTTVAVVLTDTEALQQQSTQSKQQQQRQQHLQQLQFQMARRQQVQQRATKKELPQAQQVQQQQEQQQPDSQQQLSFDNVAVGGTFDRLHAGHRLLLAATALVSSSKVFVGITADNLLAKKANKHLLQDYNHRRDAAVDFMVMVRPGLSITAGALTDPKAPTVAELDPTMEALVVSQETLPGGEAINEARIARGFAPLHLVVVGVVGAYGASAGKLSSTTLREADASAAEGQAS